MGPYKCIGHYWKDYSYCTVICYFRQLCEKVRNRIAIDADRQYDALRRNKAEAPIYSTGDSSIEFIKPDTKHIDEFNERLKVYGELLVKQAEWVDMLMKPLAMCYIDHGKGR